MKKTSNNQQGFTALEVLLITLILVVIVGAGYLVYHNNHKATVNSSNSSSRNSSSVAIVSPATHKLLVINQWGVQIPYTSTDTLSYKADSDSQILIGSKELGDKYGYICGEYGGGGISRVLGTEIVSAEARATYGGGDYQTYNDLYAQKPSVFAAKIKGYYYYFVSSPGTCIEHLVSGSTSSQSSSNAAEIKAEDSTQNFVKSILSHVEPIS